MNRVLLYALALLLLLPDAASALGDADVLVVREGTGRYPLGPAICLLEDPRGILTFDEVRSPASAGRFTRVGADSPSFGFTRSVFWVRFTLRTERHDDEELLLELAYPLMDSFRVFTPRKNGGYRERLYGTLQPFSARDVPHRNHVFRLEVPAGETLTCYLRFENEDRMELPLILWTKDAFEWNLYRHQFALGAYYGILFIMFLYNLFLFISLRSRSYLYYILYITALALFQLTQDGLAYQVLSGLFAHPPVHYIPLTSGLLLLAVLQFFQSFLNTAMNTRRIHLFMNGLKLALAVYLLAFPFLDYMVAIQASTYLTLVIIPPSMAAGYIAIRNRYRPAYYYMASWTIMALAGLVLVLRLLAVVPHNMFTYYILHLGTSIELALLSLGLGDRFNLMRQERERIAVEMATAHRIQQSLMPAGMPELAGMRAHCAYLPMEEVGGDFFDYHVIDDRYVGILVADVSGHGVPAAIVSSMVKLAFSQQHVRALQPAQVLMGIWEVLHRELGDTFITAGYVVLDLRDRSLRFAKCGHLPLYVRRRDGGLPVLLDTRGRFIGKLPLPAVEEASMDLAPGDKIVLITDGVIESVNRHCRNDTAVGDEQTRMFGFERFAAFLAEHGALPPAAFSDLLLRTLQEWVGPGERFDDDVTVIVVDIS